MAKLATEGVFSKLRKIRDIIKFNGGIKGSLGVFYRTDELKMGELVGEDQFGNKYYRNDEHFMARNKWVIYNPNFSVNYNASQIPPEWHRWLSDMCDTPPSVEPPVKYKWMKEHRENMTGTNQRYVPYSTTRSKVESWTPPK